MCGSSAAQNQINQEQIQNYQAQTQFLQMLQAQYQQEFSQNQEILSELTSMLQPLVTAGPSQQGFSPEEMAALNTQAMQSAANSYVQSTQAVNEQMMARGGGNEFIPSGAQAQVEAQLAQNAQNQLAANQLNILQNSYNQGNQNWRVALGALSGVPSAIESPLASSMGALNSATNATTNTGVAAANEANAINAANNSWMGILGGVLDTAVGGLTGGIGGAIGGLIAGSKQGTSAPDYSNLDEEGDLIA